MSHPEREPIGATRSRVVSRGLMNLAMVVVACGALHLSLVRPWVGRWGATGDEIRASMPGDERIDHPRLRSTRAVTVRAPIERVWPYVVQLGQDRAGFYTYVFIEDLMSAGIRNTLHIEPQWQSRSVGDEFKLAASMPGLTVFAVEAPRVLGVVGDSRVGRSPIPLPPGVWFASTWVFELNDRGDGSTRLISRWAADWRGSAAMSVGSFGLVEWGAFVMERRMLMGIRDLAEGRAQAAPIPNWSDWTWFLSLWADGVAIVLTAFGRRRQFARWVCLGGAVLTQLACFLLPPFAAFAIPITVVLAFGVWLTWSPGRVGAVGASA
jgi:hypothetical protein